MGQLDFRPRPFPDETLFSLVSRYHRLTGFRDYRDTLELLFGTSVVLPHCAFPRHLQEVCSSLFSEEGLAFVVDHLTIFPYFRPFLPAWQADKAASYLAGKQTGAIKTLLGIVASQVGAETLYRFCQACLSEDQLKYGQAYWHRVHQLPGGWICPIHHLPLLEVDRAWMAGQRWSLALPDEHKLNLHATPLPVGASQRDLLGRLAQLNAKVLGANLGVASPQFWRHRYLTQAIDLGLARPSGRLRLSELQCYLQRTLAQLPGQREFRAITSPSGELPSWLLMLLHKPRSALHPLKHLILAEGLGLGGDALLQYSTLQCSAEPRGDSVEMPSTLREPRTGRASDGVLCQILAEDGGSLRQAALFTGVSVTTLRLDATRLGLSVKTRPKTLTPLVISALEQDFLAGMSLNDIAAKEQLSLVSLYRILRMRPSMAKQWRDQRANREIAERRHRFLDDMSNMSLRKSPEYAWLYRHDRTWLQQQVVEYGKVPHRTKERVDWVLRDRILADRVAAWSMAPKKQKGRPTRVTMSSLGRALHVSALLANHLNRLPLTKLASEAVIESPEQFQCRRLIWARDQLHAKGEPISRWRLLRQAGIRSPSSAEVLQFILDLCQEKQ